MSKIFVLDTNIILHDYKSVKSFQDNDIVIPMAVIEELDKFKKGNDALSFNARAFMREITKLTDRQKFGKRGVPLGLSKSSQTTPSPRNSRTCSRTTSRITASCPRPCGCGTTIPAASWPS